MITNSVLCFNSYGQETVSHIRFKGSYYISAICKDGIVVGMDTRGTFLDGQTVLAYFDSVQKVFIVKNCIVSIGGLIAIGNKFVSSILDEFEKTLPDNIAPDDLIIKFEEFFLSNYPAFKKSFAALRTVAYGYIDGKATICALDIKKCVQGSAVVSGDALSKFGANKPYDDQFCLKHTCDEIAPIIEDAIKEYAVENNKTTSVGGDIMLLKIVPGNIITWLKNQPGKKNWNTTQEFLEEYRKGNVPITFVSERYEKAFKNDNPLY